MIKFPSAPAKPLPYPYCITMKINRSSNEIFLLRGREKHEVFFELPNFYQKSGPYVVSGLYRPLLSEILRPQLPRSSEKKLGTDGWAEIIENS